MSVTINEERFAGFLEYMIVEWDGFDFEDFDSLNTIVQELLGANAETVFELPEGAEGLAYTFIDDDPGFLFGLRPRRDEGLLPEFRFINVTGIFVESRSIEPRDADGKLPVDGAEFPTDLDNLAACLQVAEHVAYHLTRLLPAYDKLWG